MRISWRRNGIRRRHSRGLQVNREADKGPVNMVDDSVRESWGGNVTGPPLDRAGSLARERPQRRQ